VNKNSTMWLWQAIEDKKLAAEHEGSEGQEETLENRMASQYCELFAALEVGIRHVIYYIFILKRP
jgi:hypothetical protein